MLRMGCFMLSKDFDYFPLKLAKGEQFCNRVDERKTLKRNIQLVRHTVLVSPRRYGKSSLVYKVASEIKIPFESVDLFLAHDDKTVIKRILVGVSNVVSQIIPVSHKALAMIQKYFSGFRVSITTSGFNLELLPTGGVIDAVDQVFDALKALALLAEEKKKNILFFIDEFQDIAKAESAKSIQGALRHVAQETSWIVFIFSGSSRNLLLELFDDKNKPLYMLCDKIMLDRIASTDYHPHIQKAAQHRWHTALDDSVINKIFTITEMHPFYINMLCHTLWEHGKPPSISDVEAAWFTCYDTEERRLVAELEKLTSNQQDVLRALVLNSVTEPTSQTFLQQIALPLSSTRQAIKALIEKDIVYVVKKIDPHVPGIKKGHYRVLDPLLAFALRRYS